MPHTNVLVFGPSGNIGSIAALTASQRGAAVHLAMRDPSKPIPSLSHLNLPRLKADLTDVPSLTAAVTSSNATAAFVYLAFGTPDHMLSTFQALKDAGIKHLVFLSSYTIDPTVPLDSINPEEIIPFVHARAEISLRQVFPREDLVAVRPGGFATNTLHYKKMIVEEGKVKLLGGEVEFDYISNEDMGVVSGNVLVSGQREGQDVVYLYGPKFIQQREAYRVLGEVLDKKVEIVEVGREEMEGVWREAGMPEPVVKYGAKKMMAWKEEGRGISEELEREAKENVRKYAGREGVSFREWAEKNKGLFE